jgi:hypothetical protein
MSMSSKVVVHGVPATPIAVDESSLLLQTTARLCPGLRTLVQVDGRAMRARVLSSRVRGLTHEGVSYVVCLAAPGILQVPAA